jgi:hypothetical protein
MRSQSKTSGSQALARGSGVSTNAACKHNHKHNLSVEAFLGSTIKLNWQPVRRITITSKYCELYCELTGACIDPCVARSPRN